MYTEKDLESAVQRCLQTVCALPDFAVWGDTSVVQRCFYLTTKSMIPSGFLFDVEREQLDRAFEECAIWGLSLQDEVFVMLFLFFYFVRDGLRSVIMSLGYSDAFFFEALGVPAPPAEYPGDVDMTQWMRTFCANLEGVIDDQLATHLEIILATKDKGRAEMMAKRNQRLAEILICLRRCVHMIDKDQYLWVGTCFAFLLRKYTSITNNAEICLRQMYKTRQA